MKHIDTFVERKPDRVDETRKAKVNRSEGESIGAPLFINSKELEELGIAPEDTNRVVQQVEDGFLLLFPAE